MIISHSRKFIFFKPLKTAGTSVEVLLRDMCGPTDIITPVAPDEVKKGFNSQNNINEDGIFKFHSHTWPDLLFEKTESTWNDYHKISMVRNPWDMCVSYYWWTMSRNKNSQLIIKDSDIDSLIEEKFRLFLETKCFYDEHILKNVDNFYKSPVSWLSDISLNFMSEEIDTYIRFESLQSDFNNVVCDLGGRPVELPRFKSNKRNLSYHYSKYYCEHTADLVKNYFSEYSDSLGYSF